MRFIGVFDLDSCDEVRVGIVGVPDLGRGDGERVNFSCSSISIGLGA